MSQVAFNRIPAEEFDISYILDAIEEQAGVDYREGDPPLHEVIDAEALCHLFAPRGTNGNRSGGQVTFQYLDFQIIIDFDIHEGNTWIRVLDADS